MKKTYTSSTAMFIATAKAAKQTGQSVTEIRSNFSKQKPGITDELKKALNNAHSIYRSMTGKAVAAAETVGEVETLPEPVEA